VRKKVLAESAASSSGKFLTTEYVPYPSSPQVLLPFTNNMVQEYPDYYQLIQKPTALSTLRKRINGGTYKTVTEFRDDFRVMFNNARQYNQEGSWVYNDADEMERVFDATYNRVITGSGLPDAPGGLPGMSDSALTPMEEDIPPPPSTSKQKGRKQIISDDEYLTQSENDE
jgi:ATP-dependent helicase STH1/SNF2